jgi:hypothetical protein
MYEQNLKPTLVEISLQTSNIMHLDMTLKVRWREGERERGRERERKRER